MYSSSPGITEYGSKKAYQILNELSSRRSSLDSNHCFARALKTMPRGNVTDVLVFVEVGFVECM
jgi:hypothetical protein